MNQRITAREWILNNFQNYSKRASCIQECATSLGISVRNARKAMIGVEKSGKLAAPWVCPKGNKPMGIKNDKDGFAQFDLIAKVPHTPEDLIEMCNLDVDVWELKRGRVNFWGNSENPNYQTRVEFTRRISEGGERFLDKIKEEMKNFSPIYPALEYPINTSEESFMLEPSIYDIHFGSMSSQKQTNDAYNPDIAASRFYQAVLKAVRWYREMPIDKILFPIGHDLFNVDTAALTTTKGTPQDEHWNWQETYNLAFQIVIQSIDLLQQIAPVHIPIVLSNHDQAKIYYFGHALEAWYHNCPNVTIVNNGHPYQFVDYGENLIGLTHGKDLKKANLPLLMATEAKELWGKAKYCEWHIGHEHHASIHDFMAASETNGVRVRMMPSLCGRDFWHTSKGYGSMKEAVALLWSKTSGNISDFKFHV